MEVGWPLTPYSLTPISCWKRNSMPIWCRPEPKGKPASKNPSTKMHGWMDSMHHHHHHPRTFIQATKMKTWFCLINRFPTLHFFNKSKFPRCDSFVAIYIHTYIGLLNHSYTCTGFSSERVGIYEPFYFLKRITMKLARPSVIVLTRLAVFGERRKTEQDSAVFQVVDGSARLCEL